MFENFRTATGCSPLNIKSHTDLRNAKVKHYFLELKLKRLIFVNLQEVFIETKRQ
jgi:hypothetical protein